MSFKFIEWEPATRTVVYCDGTDHVEIVPPINQYAHENYDVLMRMCDCAPVVTSVPVSREAPTEPTE